MVPIIESATVLLLSLEILLGNDSEALVDIFTTLVHYSGLPTVSLFN